MSPALRSIFGPRISPEDFARHRMRYLLPTLILVGAAILLIASFIFPYWKMTLHAPQYPGGLHVPAYLNHLEGDVREIDGLNHYIGMRSLNDAGQLERSTELMAVVVMGLLVVAAVFIRNPWAAMLALPAILFPAGFLFDLYYWLNSFGQNLDPGAALSSSIEPFTPPVLGEGRVGQFRTVAWAGPGLYMAAGASVLVIIGLYFHRRAYKPILDEIHAAIRDFEKRRRSGMTHTTAPTAGERGHDGHLTRHPASTPTPADRKERAT